MEKVRTLLSGTDTSINLYQTASDGSISYSIQLEAKDGTVLKQTPLSSFLKIIRGAYLNKPAAESIV